MNNLKKLTALLLSVLLIVGVMAGCGSSESGEPAQEAVNNTSDTHTMTFGIQNYGAGCIDPAKETNAAWNNSRYGVGECLFKFDDAMNVYNTICDSYTVNDEHTEWIFHIREGVKFSDGCDVTAEAVKASFERLFEAGASGSSDPENFLEVDAELIADNNAGTFTIKTHNPYVDLTKNLAHPVFVILDVEHTTDYDHAAIGTGPYVATNFREEVGYTMVANEHYWGGEVPYDSIELMYMGDASAKAMALQAGQLDLAENVTNISDLRTLQEDSNFTVTIANGVRTGLAHMNIGGISCLRQKGYGFCQFVGGHGGNGSAVKAYFSAVGLMQSADDTKQSGFSTAVGADDGSDGLFRDHQRKVRQLLFPIVATGDIAKLNHCCCALLSCGSAATGRRGRLSKT